MQSTWRVSVYDPTVTTLTQTTSLLRARMLYDRLVAQFPTSGRYWRLYIEQEVKLTRIMWCSAVMLHVVYAQLEWARVCRYVLCVVCRSTYVIIGACYINFYTLIHH